MFATDQGSLCGRGLSFYGNILLHFEFRLLPFRVMAIIDWVLSTFLI